MLQLSLRENGLDSSFKEVRVFKVRPVWRLLRDCYSSNFLLYLFIVLVALVSGLLLRPPVLPLIGGGHPPPPKKNQGLFIEAEFFILYIFTGIFCATTGADGSWRSTSKNYW